MGRQRAEPEDMTFQRASALPLPAGCQQRPVRPGRFHQWYCTESRKRCELFRLVEGGNGVIPEVREEREANPQRQPKQRRQSDVPPYLRAIHRAIRTTWLDNLY